VLCNACISDPKLICPRRSTLFPYTTLFRSNDDDELWITQGLTDGQAQPFYVYTAADELTYNEAAGSAPSDGTSSWTIYSFIGDRSEEHTSELQSRENLVCRLLLEKKKDRRI